MDCVQNVDNEYNLDTVTETFDRQTGQGSVIQWKESVGTISYIAKKKSNSSAARLMDRVSGLGTDRRMYRVNNIHVQTMSVDCIEKGL